MSQVAKFDQKAIVLYGCPQVTEGISVKQNFFNTFSGLDADNREVELAYRINTFGAEVSCYKGIITYTPGVKPQEIFTKIPFKDGENPFKTLSVGSYIYDIQGSISLANSELKGDILGRIQSIAATVPNTVGGITTPVYVRTLTLEELPVVKPFITGVQMKQSGGIDSTEYHKFRVGLGPKNAIAALNFNFSIDTTSDSFQYIGDELDRDEVTVITDRTCKFDFETFVPVLGTYDNKVDLGITVGSATFTSYPDSNGDPLYTDEIVVTLANTVVNNIITASAILVYTAIPIGSYLNYYDASGNLIEIGKITGKVADGTVRKLTIASPTQVYADSAAANNALANKTLVLTLTESVANIPLSSWFQATGMSLTVVPSAKQYYITNKRISNTFMTVEIHRASPDMRLKDKVYTLTDVRGSIDLDLVIGSKPKFKFAFEGNVNQAKIAAEHLKVFPDFEKQKQTTSNTLKSSSISYISLREYDGLQENIPAPATESNIEFNKITAPNFTGFEYSRYQTSGLDSWSKGGTPSDLTVSILEDISSSAVVFDPHDNLEMYHTLELKYKKNDVQSGIGSTVRIVFDKLQLTKVTAGTIAKFVSQDVGFRNVGKTTIYFS